MDSANSTPVQTLHRAELTPIPTRDLLDEPLINPRSFVPSSMSVPSFCNNNPQRGKRLSDNEKIAVYNAYLEI